VSISTFSISAFQLFRFYFPPSAFRLACPKFPAHTSRHADAHAEANAQGRIASDPNRMDDEQYIVRLLGQVITVSLETMKVVKGLPSL
jgi:hypothetical protein